jgi:hypothetical protein
MGGIMKDTDYGAPPEPKGNYRSMTYEEILVTRKFVLRIGEDIRDYLDDEQAAIMASYIYHKDDMALGNYVRDVLCERVLHVLNRIRYESEPVEPVDPEAP